MFDLAAVGAKDGALLNFFAHPLDGKAAADHVRHVELFALANVVVELKRAVVGEPAALTRETLRVIVEPLAKDASPTVNNHAPAFLALEVSVDFTG
jgi:hypothetical protein